METMSSKQDILDRISKAKPVFSALPEETQFHRKEGDLKQIFIETAELNGSVVKEIENLADVLPYIQQNFDFNKRVVTSISKLENQNIEYLNETEPHSLQDIEVAIIEGSYGVAENAAIWVTENQIKNRVLPFITQNLVLIFNPENIVALMTDVYEVIENTEEGFSTFISGPSKTADIEQSLVIGAHGSRSLHILLLKDIN